MARLSVSRKPGFLFMKNTLPPVYTFMMLG